MIVAVYSMKGGVGKTTLAVNLAWASATLSSRRTLLWDLDGQGAASFVLGHDPKGSKAVEAIAGERDPARLVERTAYDRLDLLPADDSLRHLDVTFHGLGKRKRLAKVAAKLGADYDRVVIDCPPGLTDTSDQVLRAADLVVVPVIPTVLSRRSLDAVAAHIRAGKGFKGQLAPVFSMVDRRRSLHRQAVEEHPGWPVVPMASAFERMSELRVPIGAMPGRPAAAVDAIAQLWRRLEKAMAA